MILTVYFFRFSDNFERLPLDWSSRARLPLWYVLICHVVTLHLLSRVGSLLPAISGVFSCLCQAIATDHHHRRCTHIRQRQVYKTLCGYVYCSYWQSVHLTNRFVSSRRPRRPLQDFPAILIFGLWRSLLWLRAG